ncbi:hypothetical protein [Streptomyces alkaliterrae]|uniref:Secreted protein/lipoprotein n=1 Tax=Streptomyces alkaliterrae TaxID=2213162 RepID=A0A5P0YWX8_9ACTN|nr:hypothetical protein [Streptomyces alkaliterrae]MQS04791.1 hypothetical protein [Streptomyces alkaliterrae]
MLKDYRASWDAQMEAYAKADSNGTKVPDYLTLDALAEVESDLMTMRKRGHITTGEAVLSPEVTRLDMKAKLPKATVRDCVDVSEWTPVKKDSGKKVSLPPERLTKYVMTSDMEHWGKRWMVVKFTVEGKRC